MKKSTLDMSGVDKIRSRLRELQTRRADFGYFRGYHSKAKMPYAQLAQTLEYGTRKESGGYKIPPRPAMGDLGLDLKSKYTEFEAVMNPSLRGFMEGDASTTSVYNKAGEHISKRYRDTMYFWLTSGSKYNSNAPMSIKMKGFNRPFVETGELIRNATYRVR